MASDKNQELQEIDRGAGSVKHQPGWDLAFSCSKSVTVLWPHRLPAVGKAIQEAIQVAQAVLKAIEDAQADADLLDTPPGQDTAVPQHQQAQDGESE